MDLVSEAIRELGDAGRMVADEVHLDREQRRKTDRVVVALLAVVVLAVGAVAWFGYSNYKLNRLIAECTTPHKQCYEAAKMQQAANRSALTRANLFIVACAPYGRDEDVLRTCVEKKLEEAGIDIPLSGLPVGGNAMPVPSAPTGPPADATIEPSSTDQPIEPTPVQPPDTNPPADNPPAPDDDTGGN